MMPASSSPQKLPGIGSPSGTRSSRRSKRASSAAAGASPSSARRSTASTLGAWTGAVGCMTVSYSAARGAADDGAARGSGRAGLAIGQGDRQLQHFVAAVVLEVDRDRLDVHLHVLLDHFQELVAHHRQIVRRTAGGALLRHDDAKALLGDGGAGFGLALEEIEDTRADQLPNTRWKKPFLVTSVKRSGLSAPRMRATVSL